MPNENTDKKMTDTCYGNRLANIISYISLIHDEITSLEDMPSVYTQYLPPEFFDFKHKFFEFISEIKLFHLNLKNNPNLKDLTVRDFDNDIDRLQDQIWELECRKAAQERSRDFFENLCNFASELKCGTTSQSSKASKQSKNA